MKISAILDWNMTAIEGEVFRLAMLYEQLYQKILAGEIDGTAYRRNALPRRNDPRQSYLFRHCWKMRRETRGLFEFSEYKNYIHANLLLVKLNGGTIEPTCICGDKAWIRYKIWKRKYDIKMSEIGAIAPPPSISTTSPKIIIEIDRTKKFLFERCEGTLTFEKVKGFIEGGIFKLWVASGKVSPYYLILSPYVAKSGEIDSLFKICSSSRSVIEEKLTTEIKDYFKHEYHHEFG